MMKSFKSSNPSSILFINCSTLNNSKLYLKQHSISTCKLNVYNHSSLLYSNIKINHNVRNISNVKLNLNQNQTQTQTQNQNNQNQTQKNNNNNKITFNSLLKHYVHVHTKLSSKGYNFPSNIQINSIPILLGPANHIQQTISQPQSDVIIQDITGSGKTLAYVLPIISRIDPYSSTTQAIIISPSRELSNQLNLVINDLTQGG